MSAQHAQARALLAAADDKLKQLQDLEPFLIDLSLRENPVGARMGQTLTDKLAVFLAMRDFGFKNILLGTLDYAMPDELEVDDDFMMYLRDHDPKSLEGGYAFTDMGSMTVTDTNSVFTPSPSMLKLQCYRVPNTLHEIYLSPAGMRAAGYDMEILRATLPRSIAWLVNNIIGDNGGAPNIFINIVDGCDAFMQNPDDTCAILELLADQPIAGISMEDDRGTYLPFQVGACVAMARSILPASSGKKILVHMHAGGGFENASVIEALLNGADGVWGGLPKRAAIIGHASLGELIANLVRVDNAHMAQYKLDALLPLATSLQELDEDEAVPDDLPIFGRNAYRLPLSFFRQQAGRFMDLPPEAIGGSYRYRICPVVSDPPVIAGRLAEITGEPAENFPQPLLEQMIRLMRRDLRAGIRIVYDDPDQLRDLYERALTATT